MKRYLARFTYANVISTLCLFLLLGGGAAYAATQLPKNSVGSKQIKKAAVTPAKLSTAAKATLTGPQGAKGDRGEKGDTGPRGPSNAYYTFNNASETNNKTISIDVPAGSYVVSGSMYAITSEATYAEVECLLYSPAGGKNSGEVDITIPPHPSGALDTYTRPQAETALSIGGAGGVITFQCGANGPATVSLYQARIVATQVETLATS